MNGALDVGLGLDPHRPKLGLRILPDAGQDGGHAS